MVGQSIPLSNGGNHSANGTVAALFAIDLVVFMDRAVLASVLLPVEEQFELNDATAGFLVTVFSVSYCASLPLVGWLSDRIPRRYVLAGGIGVWSMTSLATGLAQTWEQLLIARSLTGIGEATCAPLGPAIIADCIPSNQRSRALGVLFAAIPIGSALGFVLGGQAARVDWRWAFYLTGLLGMVAAISAIAIREVAHEFGQPLGIHHPRTGWMRLLHEARFVHVTLGMALTVFALIGWSVWAPTFLAKVRGWSLEGAGLFLGIILVGAAVGGATLGGWLGDRLGRRGPSALASLVALTTLASVPCLAIALYATDPVILLASLALGLTLIFLNVGPLDTMLIAITSPSIRGTALALNVLLIHLLGEMPAPIAIGAMSDATGSLTGGLLLALAILCAGALVFCRSVRFLKKV